MLRVKINYARNGAKDSSGKDLADMLRHSPLFHPLRTTRLDLGERYSTCVQRRLRMFAISMQPRR